MWQKLPEAVYNEDKKTLHVATGFDPLLRCNTIYVRECHDQLTRMALEMIPRDERFSGMLGTQMPACPIRG